MTTEFEFKKKMRHLIEKAETDIKLIQEELDEFKKHIGMI